MREASPCRSQHLRDSSSAAAPRPRAQKRSKEFSRESTITARIFFFQEENTRLFLQNFLSSIIVESVIILLYLTLSLARSSRKVGLGLGGLRCRRLPSWCMFLRGRTSNENPGCVSYVL